MYAINFLNRKFHQGQTLWDKFKESKNENHTQIGT